MTEAEWLVSSEIGEMLQFRNGPRCFRKRRLFSCACVRRVQAQVQNEADRSGIELVERYAEGLVTAEALNMWLNTHARIYLEQHLAYRTVLSEVHWDNRCPLFFNDPRPNQFVTATWDANVADRASRLAAVGACPHLRAVELDFPAFGNRRNRFRNQ